MHPRTAEPSHPIEALIFDLDDTLVDATAAYAAALAALDLPVGSSGHVDFLQARSTVKARLGHGHVSARNRLLYFKQMLGRASAAAVLDCMARYETALTQHIAQQWHTLGHGTLLEQLARLYPIVVLTNENTRTQLLKMQVLDSQEMWCTALVTSEEIGVEKPHAAMFAAAAAVANVPPERCLMIGDSIAHDIEPARALGWRAWLTTQFWPADVTKPRGDDVIPRLDTVRERLS